MEDDVMYTPRGRGRHNEFAAVKLAVGAGSDLAEMLTRLERCKEAFPRMMLEASIQAYLVASPERRRQIVRAYLASLAHPAMELLPQAEAEAVRDQLSAIYG